MPTWHAADCLRVRFVHRQKHMVYHSKLDTAGCPSACGLPLIPLRSNTDRSPNTDKQRDIVDIVDESLFAFRANILFKSFEVIAAADKLLIYITLFLNQCLKRKKICRAAQKGMHDPL